MKGMRELIERYTVGLPDSLELSHKELSDLKRRARFFSECFYDEGGEKCEHYKTIYEACIKLEVIAEKEELAAIEHALEMRKARLDKSYGGSSELAAADQALERLGSGILVEENPHSEGCAPCPDCVEQED